MQCKKTFIWKASHNKVSRRKHWFKLWITESYNIRQLCKLSTYSKSTLNRIKQYWLNQTPKECMPYDTFKYIIYDATYFHKDGCLLNIMDAVDQTICAHLYVNRENFKNTYPWFLQLKQKGLDPLYVTMDGEQSIMRSIKRVWPNIKIQRCLYHIQHEGMRWLRSHPITEAGKKLRDILKTLPAIKTIKERDLFILKYQAWVEQYRNFIMSLPKITVAFKDLQRTMVLISNALPNMFHYLRNNHVHPTTNALEGFHSRLKSDYQRHRGLIKENRIKYICWYCYFKNSQNSNTF